MEKKKNFIINKLIHTINEEILFENLSKHQYSESKGFGLSNIELNEQTVSGTLLKRNVTTINDYNHQNRHFERRQIFYFSENTFIIDLKKQILITFGSATQQNALKNILKLTLNNLISIEQYILTPYNCLQRIIEKNIKYTLVEITISEFRYNPKIIGKYQARILDKKIGLSLIEQYKNESSKICVEILSGLSDFTISVLNNGAISFIGEEDDFEENLNYLTSIFFD